MIIYLHGYGSNGNAFKARLIRRLYPELPLFSPDLPREPEKALRLVTDYIKTLPDRQKCLLLGSSLGGFYALHLNTVLSIPAILLNPTINPGGDLKSRMELDNELLQRLNSEENAEILIQLARLYHPPETLHTDNLTVHLNRDDEILDYRIAEKYFQKTPAKLVVHPAGGHVFLNFMDILPEIIEYYHNL
ncbi:MAG TPA: alpha/beta fold hydrolase [Candidatus Marinimicrobia bacterium]|nr:alpha/beta fold hydrolase [Candidatus Neomarinimicrobiota bacterium]